VVAWVEDTWGQVHLTGQGHVTVTSGKQNDLDQASNMVSDDWMSAMMDPQSFNGRSTTTTTMTGMRQLQIESTVRRIKSSQMDQVESRIACMHRHSHADPSVVHAWLGLPRCPLSASTISPGADRCFKFRQNVIRVFHLPGLNAPSIQTTSPVCMHAAALQHKPGPWNLCECHSQLKGEGSSIQWWPLLSAVTLQVFPRSLRNLLSHLI
jgi:hypothetical protein